MEVKLALALVVLSPMALRVFVSATVNCRYPLLLTVLIEAAPPFQLPLDWFFIRLLLVAATLDKSELFQTTCSSKLLQALAAGVPPMLQSMLEE